MQADNILKADVLDILFEHKNKNYGAYNLRRTYNKRLCAALGGTLIAGMIFSFSTLFAGGKKVNTALVVTGDVLLASTPPDKTKVEKPIPIPVAPAGRPQLRQVNTLAVTPPRIVRDVEADPQNQVPPVAEIEKAQIGTMTIAGDAPGGDAPVLSGNGVGGPGTGSGPGKVAGSEVLDEVFATVQIEAKFPGGPDEWRKFLERNLNRDLPVENGAPPTSYKVVVSFIVDREGNVSDVKAENNPGYGTAEEAVRIIKKSKKWQPAVQNGRNVIYRQRQAITFLVSED